MSQDPKELKEYKKALREGFIQIKSNDSAEYRKQFYKQQNGICPVLKQKMSFEESSLDHKHRRKSDPFGGKEGLGLIRGVLHKSANAWEGKVYNAFKRLGLHKKIGFSEALRNLADFIDNPTVEPKYIYPSEEPKQKKSKLNKTDYNRVVKYWHEMYPKRKLPKKPKSGNLTKEWKQYILKANKIHEKRTGKKLKGGKNG